MKVHLPKAYLFPLAAALCYGSSMVLARQGVKELAPPLVGAAVAMFWGSLMLVPQALTNARAFFRSPKRAIIFFVLAGIAADLGVISNYYALSLAPVVVVAPLTSINPMVTILWSFIFLRRLEKITPRLIVGALLVVAGVAIVTLGGR